MNEEEREEEHAWRREELRGLFTLSLLASLFVIWTNLDKVLPQKELVMPVIGVNVYPFVPVGIYIIIFFWTIYAVLMILRFSDDIIESKPLRLLLESIARVSFILGPIIALLLFFVSLSLFLFVFYLPTSLYVLIGILVLVALPVVYLALRKKYRISVIVERRKP